MNKTLELYTYLRKKGIRDTVSRIKQRYFSVTKFIVYRRDLEEDFNGIELGPEYTVSKDDFFLLDKIRSSRADLPREFYVDKTHGGKHFYLVLKNGEVAYIHWVMLKGDYSRFLKINRDGIAELNYNTTLPEYRGNKLMARTINYICKDLKKAGYKTLYGVIADGNHNSHMSLKRTGFRAVCTLESGLMHNDKATV